MDKPQVGDQLNAHRRSSDVASELTHDARLRDVLVAMYSSGPDAKEDHDRAVESLKREPDAMMVSIIAAYGRCPRNDYPQRQALVHVASIMAYAGALPFLESVALSRVPTEGSVDTHSYSTVAEETILRMAAVEGIAHHAALKNKRALDLLVRCIEGQPFSVRRAAILGIMAAPGGKRLRARIQAMIPKEEHFVFDLQRVSVHEAVQVKDPTRHLTENYKEFEERKPNVFGVAGEPPSVPPTR